MAPTTVATKQHTLTILLERAASKTTVSYDEVVAWLTHGFPKLPFRGPFKIPPPLTCTTISASQNRAKSSRRKKGPAKTLRYTNELRLVRRACKMGWEFDK